MKKTLSILLLLGCMTMLCAQGRINVKYHGVEYSNGDTIRIELAADASSCEELSFHNISNSRIEDMVITLDSISEAAIQAAINPLIEERTSILIAHRLSTILAADEILVVRDGEIVERGKHKDLVHAGGTYQELYETQFSKAMET